MSFEDWRHNYPQDFNRACDALIAANRLDSATPTVKPTGATVNLWTILTSGFVGAILTMVGGEWKSRRDRQVQAALALRGAAAAFVREGNAIARALSAPMAQADDRAYYTARDELASKIHEAAVIRDSALGAALIEEIFSTNASDVVARWPDDNVGKKVKQLEVSQWLTTVEADSIRVAALVQRLWPWHFPFATGRNRQSAPGQTI
ncbi:hypothetical protein [Micromonospora maris]|nr:hypothetical protein [Micromonospora maris]